jgi:hypothetical protein
LPGAIEAPLDPPAPSETQDAITPAANTAANAPRDAFSFMVLSPRKSLF